MGGGNKVAIIGCGIGGSAVGALLAKDGFQVEIFERTRFIGGRFASYKKSDFRLDVGCHIIANCDQGIFGTICEIFPGVEKHILWVESTSSKWIDNLFGEGGNVVGVGQTLSQVGPNRPPIVDPAVKNLYHCSADSGLQGIGGELAADSAVRLYRMLSKG